MNAMIVHTCMMTCPTSKNCTFCQFGFEDDVNAFWIHECRTLEIRQPDKHLVSPHAGTVLQVAAHGRFTTVLHYLTIFHLHEGVDQFSSLIHFGAVHYFAAHHLQFIVMMCMNVYRWRATSNVLVQWSVICSWVPNCFCIWLKDNCFELCPDKNILKHSLYPCMVSRSTKIYE